MAGLWFGAVRATARCCVGVRRAAWQIFVIFDAPKAGVLGPGATKLSVVFSPKAVGNENKLGGFIFY